MADKEPIVRTISSCEKELDDIQGILEGLSTDINNRMSQKGTATLKREKEQRKVTNTDSLHFFLTCNNKDFELKTNRMSVTDLDLTQMTLQAELKTLQSYLKQSNSVDEKEITLLNKKISFVQDRVYRCITKRGQVLVDRNVKDFERRRSQEFLEESVEAPPKPERFITRQSVHSKEIEDLSVNQLEVLLRHNSIDFPENSDQEMLLRLVTEKLLPEEWDPPDTDSISWTNATDMGCSKTGTLPTSASMDYTGSTSPVDGDFFLLNPNDLQDYMKFKALNENKLIDWDPTDLLRELYGKITVGARKLRKAATIKNKKVNCMQGYLEKLPMNQTKVTLFKGYKKRFFQVSRGKLFYYEDHKSEAPFGSIDILGSEIEPGENKTIHITARLKFGANKILQGNKLVLRCSSDSELSDWLASLKAMSVIEPVPDTFVREGSLKKREGNNSVIVIDLGSTTIRAGLTSDALPVIAFPAAFAVKKSEVSEGRRFTDAGLPDPHSCRCGFEAYFPANRKDAKIVYPLRASIKVDKYSVKVRYIPGLLEKVFHELGVETTNKVVVLSCPRYLSDKDREYILDYMFGQMCVDAVYMQEQALLALYSYNVTTGVIVDIGDHLDVLPVVEGSVIERGVTSLPYAGQQITEYLGKLLTENGYRLFSDIESFIVRYVKEEVAEASVDFQEDMTSSPNLVDINIERFHIPDSRKEIRVGNMKFRCVEGLFNPGLYGKDDVSLHHIVERSIKACDMDQRRELCRNIYLSGGSSCISGLKERLQQELKACLPENVNIEVTASAQCLNAAFKGATIVAGLEHFEDMVISRNEWHMSDAAILLSKWHTK